MAAQARDKHFMFCSLIEDRRMVSPAHDRRTAGGLAAVAEA
jgi:hypothetical protein